MQTALPRQPQNVHRRVPKLAIPLDGDVSSVRYYKCPPKMEPAPSKASAFPPKIHLTFIPPSLRRPTPWSAFLTEWLSSCEDRKKSGSEDDDTSCNSSTSGACSADSASTDFSSISSPRMAAASGFAHSMPQQQQLPPAPPTYPFRVPQARATPRSQNLSPAQWAELMELQQVSARPKQHPPPPSLMDIHTAYLPELDAAVQLMMHPSLQTPERKLPAAGTVPAQPWLPHAHYYATTKRNSLKGASSIGGSSASSTHGSDGVDKSQATCTCCYEHAVHEANARPGTHLPRLTDRGNWRGHVLKEGDVIVCPRLLRRVCSLCGATGQSAHLTNLCPATNRITTKY